MNRHADDQAPSGFEPLKLRSAFVDSIGNLYWRFDPPEVVRMGLRLQKAHCNLAGTAHGGIIATLCDIVLGRVARAPDFEHHVSLTANLNINFIGSGQSGEWLEGRASRSRAGSRMIFATCEIYSDDRMVATASGVFVKKRLPGVI